MATIDFPTDVSDTTPTFLVGGNAALNAGAGGPSKAVSGPGGLAVLAAADAASARGSLGLGTAATQASTAFAAATHASQHKAAGADAIKLDELAAPTDVTTLNATTGAHGLLPKLSGSASDVFKGDGTWGVGASGGSWTVQATSFTAAANGQYLITANATVTDPTPVEGLTFMVEVRAGTAVVGGESYSGSQLIIRSYHNSAWASAVYTPGVGLSAPVPLVDGATITVDLATGTDFTVTLGGNRTLVFTNLSAGRRGVIQVTQDATGGRTLNAPVGARTPGGAGILLTQNGSALDFVNYWYDGVKLNIAAGYRNMA